jgi:hypothetical protein
VALDRGAVAARPGQAARATEGDVIDLPGLTRALATSEQLDHAIADWVVLERDQELATVGDGLRRTEHRTRWQLTLHVDVPAGRGSASVALDTVAVDPEVVVEQAVGLAHASVGPAWRSSSPAAPARVTLEDAAIAGRDLAEVADGIARGTSTPTVAHVLREHVTATTRAGFHMAWGATLVRATALVSIAEHSLELVRDARRVGELDLASAIAIATTDLELLAKPAAPTPGPCAIVLAADAMLHGDLGVWAAFESQADATLARRGLTRIRERVPIAPGAELVAEPLTVASDGALAYGTRSAPLADTGEAVRRFAIVERGVAAGLGLGPREAGLRRRDPNGGVRNLVVTAGTWTGETTGRVIEIRRLRDLAIDPYTAEATLEIALGLDGDRPFTGGTVRLDLLEALSRARRSATRIRRGAYHGPGALWIDRAELLP